MLHAISSIKVRVSSPESWAGTSPTILGSREAVQLMLGALELNIGGWRFLFTSFRSASVMVDLFGVFVFRFAFVLVFLISVSPSATRIARRSITRGDNRRQTHGGDIFRHVSFRLLGLNSSLYDPRTRNCSRIEPATCAGE